MYFVYIKCNKQHNQSKFTKHEIEQHVLDTSAGKQQSQAATDV